MVCLAYKTVDQSFTRDTEKNKNSDLKWERAQVIIRVYWPTAVCKYMCICVPGACKIIFQGIGSIMVR